MTQTTESIWDRNNLALSVGSLLAVTIAAVQGLAVATITPVLTKDLEGEHLYGWVFNAFLIPQIVGTVYGGREVDRRPPWQIFYPALVLFAIGLVVCSVSDSMGLLLIGRMLTGFGSGALTSTVYAIIGGSYNDKLRPDMLAALSAAWVVPSLIGPVIAGAVADSFHWRWVFVGLLPLVLISGGLTWNTYSRVVLDNDPETAGMNRTRLPLAITLAVGTFLFLAGPDLDSLIQLAGDGVSNVPLVGLVAVTLAGLALIAPTLHKLMPAGTFTMLPMLPAAIFTRSLVFGAFAITETYVVYSLKEFGGLSSSQAGILLTIGSLTWTVGSVAQARLDRRSGATGRAGRMLFGAIAMLLGCGVIIADVVINQTIHWPITMVSWAFVGLGIGICATTGTSVAFQYTPKGQGGRVSSSFLLLDLFANAIGVGIGGFLLAFTLDRGWNQPAAAALSMSLSLVFMVIAIFGATRMVRAGEMPAPNGA